MNSHSRTLSYATLALAVMLPSLVLAFAGGKDLARLVFVAVLVTGYGYIFIRWRLQQRG